MAVGVLTKTSYCMKFCSPISGFSFIYNAYNLKILEDFNQPNYKYIFLKHLAANNLFSSKINTNKIEAEISTTKVLICSD